MIPRLLAATAGFVLVAASLAPGNLAAIGGPELGALLVFLGVLAGVYLLFYGLTGRWLWRLGSRSDSDRTRD